ncbi:MAG: diacylglycerol kinase family protein [Chitinophagaceae bacterium]|nr:diacylglycerol kinase family protein [Chitinophagaceae bacterium]
MTNEKFSIRSRAGSFGYAFKGLKHLLRYEHNAIIHLLATVIVIIAGLLLKLQAWEWIVISFAAGFVWVTEILNTCIERIMDYLSMERDPKIGTIKDLAAGAVLVSAITALIAGGFVFIPKIIALL